MSVQVKRRRDTAANIAGFTPAQGELIVDVTNNRVIVGDGSTAGGWPAAKLSEVTTVSRHAVSDANYTALSTDRLIAYTAITAARTVSLPTAASYPVGTLLIVADETGNCSSSKTITLSANGTDVIDGSSSFVLEAAFAAVAIESNGGGAWTVVWPLQNLGVALVGVGTAPDPSNALSVYGASALFNGTNFSFTINKSASANTASIIFEDGFSGRAQLGLNGSDNFSFKVSPNGSSWTTAIALDATTGAPTFANQRTAVSDVNYSALATDRMIAFTAITAARTITLPAASAYPAGTRLTVVDESGGCSATITITLNRAGFDLINGATSAVLSAAYGYLAIESNGSNAWTIVDAVGVASFNGRIGAVTLALADVTGAGGAPIASPTFTGTPAAPTPAAGDSSTKLATTGFVAASFAPLASPTFTGTVTVPTPTAGDNSTKAATTAFVAASFAPLASPALTGTPTAPTPSPGDNSTKLATTGFVAASFAPLASPALTGTPTAPTAAVGDNSTKLATTGFVAAAIANNETFRNRLINGDMRWDQRNEGASVATMSVYSVDRWKLGGTQSGKFSAQQVALSAANAATVGLPYAVTLTSSSAYTPVSSDTFGFSQFIEADAVGDLQWGSSSAASVVLSFWAQASVAGTYAVAVRNAAATRSYVATFSLSSANAWTKITLAIPGDSGGTWVTYGAGSSIQLYFPLGAGSTYQASSAGSWQTGNYTSVSGAVNLVAASGATLQLTGVQFERGSVATAFEFLPPDVSLERCRRYYEKSYTIGTAVGTVTNVGAAQAYLAGLPSAVYSPLISVPYKEPKRASPTVTLYSPSTGASGKLRDNQNNADVAAAAFTSTSGPLGFGNATACSAAATTYNMMAHWTADCDF